MKKVFLFLCFFISCSLNNPALSQKSVDLFVFAGQSNANGVGISSENPYPSDSIDNEILLSYVDTLEGLSNELNCVGLSGGGRLVNRHPWGPLRLQRNVFGPEISFARKLKHHGFNPAIFKYAFGETSLAHNWTPGHPDRHASAMITHLQSAVDDLEDRGYQVNIRGFIWIQGENDRLCPDEVEAYAQNLRFFIDELKNQFNLESLPTVIGYNDIERSWIPGSVSNEMREIAEERNDVTTHLLQDHRSLYEPLLLTDLLHLTTQGRIVHGENLFDLLVKEEALLYKKYEIKVDNIDDLAQQNLNPFDKDDIQLHATFTSPSGKKHKVDGFYYQRYHMEDRPGVFHKYFPHMVAQKASIVDQDPDWRIRFTPDEVGGWSLEYDFILNGQPRGNPFSHAFTVHEPEQDNPSFIIPDNMHHLSYENGEAFFPIGLNVAVVPEWQGDVYPLENFYDLYFRRLKENGGNYARVWLDHIGSISIFNHNDGENYLRRFNLRSSYVFDKIVESAEKHGIKLQLAFFVQNNFNYDSTNNIDFWENTNTFSHLVTSEGLPGPCETREDFFDPNNEARRIQENYIRYIIDRYGYSTSIATWEIFQEYSHIKNFDWNGHHRDVRDWHTDIYALIKQMDYKKRAITTSAAYLYTVLNFDDDDPSNDEIYIDDNSSFSPDAVNSFIEAEASMDVVQPHRYSNEWDHDHQNTSILLNRILRGYRSPMLFKDKLIRIGEFGPLDLDKCKGPIEDRETTPSILNKNYPLYDPHGIGHRNALWETFFNGAYGTLAWDWFSFVDRSEPEHNATRFMQHIKEFSDFVSLGAVPIDNTRFFQTEIKQDNSLPGLDVVYMANADKMAGYVQRNQAKLNHLIDSYNKSSCSAVMDNYVYTLNPSDLAAEWPCPAQNDVEYITIENALGSSYVNITWYDTETGSIVDQFKNIVLEGEQASIPMPTHICDTTFSDLVFVIEKISPLILTLEHNISETCPVIPNRKNNTGVKSSQCATKTTNYWQLEDMEDNEFRIRNVTNDTCLYTIHDPTKTDGGLVYHDACGTDDKFIYTRKPFETGYIYANKDTNKCLYTEPGSGKIKAWSCWNDRQMVYNDHRRQYGDLAYLVTGQITGNWDSSVKLEMICLSPLGDRVSIDGCTIDGSGGVNTCSTTCPQGSTLVAKCSTTNPDLSINTQYFSSGFVDGISYCSDNERCSVDTVVRGNTSIACNIED